MVTFSLLKKNIMYLLSVIIGAVEIIKFRELLCFINGRLK